MIVNSVKSFTRAANTTQYAIGDVVGSLLSFSVAGNSGCIRSSLLIDSVAAATPPSVDLVLFSAAPTVAADNAVFAPTDTEMQSLIGSISFLTGDFIPLSVNGYTVKEGLDILYSLEESKKTVYGVLVARNTYTPASGEIFNIGLGSISE